MSEPNMKELPVVRAEFEEVREFADFRGLYHDLVAVIEMTKRLSEFLRQGSQDHLLIRSLWTSALVIYARCFTSGKRYGLPEDIFSDLPGEPIAAHRSYIHTRNKHIAHSVNVFEETHIGVVLSTQDQEAESIDVLGVAELHSSRLSDAAEGVEQLGRLAAHAIRHVVQESEKLEKKILDKAKSLSVEQLRSLPRLGTTPRGGLDAARTPRP